jgi:uncharacterized repeat protein (TIGR02543 family)
MGAKDVVLYATWTKNEIKYSVTYNANAPGIFTGTAPIDTKAYPSNDVVTLLGNTGKMDVEGFRFSGWTQAPDGKGRIFVPGEQIMIPEGGMKLYANWEKITRDRFLVTYNLNGEKGESPVDGKLYNVGSEVWLADRGLVPSRTGITFEGWNTQADGKGTLYKPGGVMTMGAKDVVLYATWIKNEIKYSVTYYANAPGLFTGKVPVDKGQYTSEEKFTVIDNVGGLKLEGFKFAGWALTAKSEKLILPGNQEKMVIGGIRLYAQWKPILLSKNDISHLKSIPFLSTWYEDVSDKTSIELYNELYKTSEYIKGFYVNSLSDQSISSLIVKLKTKTGSNIISIRDNERLVLIIKQLFKEILTDIDKEIMKLFDLKKYKFGSYTVSIESNANQIILKADLKN